MDDTGNQQPIARLCDGGCGFYGRPETNNLCSKCYSNYMKEEAAKHHEALPLEDPFRLPPGAMHYLQELAIPPTNPFPCFNRYEAQKTFTRDAAASTTTTTTGNLPTKKNRCHGCNKRVGLTGFACRCGGMFCRIHRYPEAHACKVDFKAAGRVALAKENPMVKADKLEDRL